MGNAYSSGTTGSDTLQSLKAEREDLGKTVACVRQMARDFDALTEQRKLFDPNRIAFHLQTKGPHLRRCVWKGIFTPEAFQWHKASMARKKVLGEQMLKDTAAFCQALVRWAENLEKREKGFGRKNTGQQNVRESAGASVALHLHEYSSEDPNDGLDLVQRTIENDPDVPSAAYADDANAYQSSIESPTQSQAHAQTLPAPDESATTPEDSETMGTQENHTPALNQSLTESPSEPKAHAQTLPAPDALVTAPGNSDAKRTQKNPTPASSQILTANSSQPQAQAQTLPTPQPLIRVQGVPSDAGSFQFNGGQKIHVPPNADFIAVYDAGVANGSFNITGINAAVGHYGIFDYQRNQGLGLWGQSTTANYFYPAYVRASNFAVGVFMAGAGYSWPTTNAVATSFGDLASGGQISSDARDMWHAGWDYGQEIKASRALRPAPLAPEDIDPYFPMEQSQ